MRHDPIVTRGLLFPLLLLGLGPSGCKSAQVTEHRVETRKASAEGVELLEVRNLRGDLEIVAYRHLTKELEITATYSVRAKTRKDARSDLERMKLRVHRDGTKAIVLVQYPTKEPSPSHSARLRIIAPADCSLDADTGVGAIRVLGLTGSVTVRTGQGNIEVLGARRAATLETRKGDVRLSGDVPSFVVRTQRGDANVLVHERATLEGPSAIVAAAGNVSLSLADSFQGQLSLQARDLVLVTPFPALKKKGNTWTGTLGSGGKLLSVSAPKGDLRLMARPYIQIRSATQLPPEGDRRYDMAGPMLPPRPGNRPPDEHPDDAPDDHAHDAPGGHRH